MLPSLHFHPQYMYIYTLSILTTTNPLRESEGRGGSLYFELFFSPFYVQLATVLLYIYFFPLHLYLYLLLVNAYDSYDVAAEPNNLEPFKLSGGDPITSFKSLSGMRMAPGEDPQKRALGS